MTMRFPKPLRSGDVIAITAPSSGVPEPMHRRLNLCMEALRRHGYQVVEGSCLRQQVKKASASKEQRARELMQFLLDPGIAAVMPPWGGELAMELLPLMDFQALSAIPPKWFAGFSDISTLHLPLTTISGWATLHGPNLMELGAAETHPLTATVWNVLAATHGSEFSQSASRQFQRKGPDLTLTPDAGLCLTENTQWKRLDGSLEPLELSGRLIGGCVDTIARLAGTRLGDIPGFVSRAGAAGCLLYIENVEMNPWEWTRGLLSLRMHGWFDDLNGLLVGRSAGPDASQANDLSYADALQLGLQGVTCPVLYDMDIGHLPPQMSLVNGARARVRFETGAGTVTQTLG